VQHLVAEPPARVGLGEALVGHIALAGAALAGNIAVVGQEAAVEAVGMAGIAGSDSKHRGPEER